LGPEISLIAVAPHGLGGEPIPPSIEAMAADRLPAILEAQPAGPYRLAGHCVGGVVALETARLLMRMNRQVETVIMIDSPWLIDGEVLKSPQGAPGDGDAGAHELFAALDALPEAGQADLDLPAQPGRKGRTARLAVRFAAMALAGYAIELIFGGLGLIPSPATAKIPDQGVSWDYTTWLNIAFLVVAAILIARFITSGGLPMVRMMGGSPEPGRDEHDHTHEGH